MNPIYISSALNILFVAAFMLDRVFRLRSISEYKDAKAEIIKSKEAQIESLKQQLEIERKNNDLEVTEMHKKRYENVKLILDEKQAENDKNKEALLGLQASLETAMKETELKKNLGEMLLAELNRVERVNHTLETEKRLLQQNSNLSFVGNLPSFRHSSFNIQEEYYKSNE
ncbi:hypothetical protein ACFGVS_19110 [Mucilaginibacter sp. AW1-7]|uniref:hypothetical protein n=1 Tax=Mucilaginibacter sp. AW1-7 TaxID=3349874 RepID=UPI003F7315A3